MRANMIRISKGIGAALLLAVLAACGSGLDSSTGSSTSTSGNGGGGNNNTPPGIPNSIVFVTPAAGSNVIALQGAGGNSNAEVTFEVDDASSTGVSGINVAFSLIPNTGNASLTTATGTTDANGRVSTFVVAGNVHTSVAVHAVISTPTGTKTADSNALAITTGIPTEGNFSIAATNLTVNNADDTQGVTDTITVLIADRFHNPAPNNTSVSFTTNNGVVDGQCFTTAGTCTVTWSSFGLPVTADGLHLPGRAEILAYTIGEESFVDADHDGTFDNSDGFTVYSGSGPGDSFTEPSNPAQDDIGEVYLDGNESGSYVGGFAVDFNHNSVRDAPDHKFYGFDCKGTPTVPCGSSSTIEIAKQICILLSTSGANIVNPAGGSITVGSGTSVTFTVTDTNGNPLARGATVNLKQSGVNGFTVTTSSNLPYVYADEGCVNAGTNHKFTVTITPILPAPTSPPPGGSLQLEVVTPGAGGAITDTVPIQLNP